MGQGLISLVTKIAKKCDHTESEKYGKAFSQIVGLQPCTENTVDRNVSTNQKTLNFIWGLGRWFRAEKAKETAKRNPSEAKLIALQDKHDCIVCFTEDCETVKQVTNKIEAVFNDNETDGIKLSSIHKAKGLEARRVFILQPEGATIPHPLAKSPWQREQEMNLLYVAITRAIEELVYVS